MHSNCSKMFNLLLADKYFGCLTEKWERYGELRNIWRISICGAERLSIRIGGWLGQMRVPICDPHNSLFRKLIINFGLPRLATAGTQDMKAGEPRRIFILLSVALIECARTGKVMMTMLGCWERNCQWWSQEIRAAGKYWQPRLHRHQGRDVETVVRSLVRSESRW